MSTITLSGKWNYRSFCSKTLPTGTDQCYPWAPLSEIDFTTSNTGAVSGTMTIVGSKLPTTITVVGQITSAPAPTADNPASNFLIDFVELTITIMLNIPTPKMSVYSIKLFASARTNHLVGTTVALKDDLGGMPNGTVGSSILFQ